MDFQLPELPSQPEFWELEVHPSEKLLQLRSFIAAKLMELNKTKKSLFYFGVTLQWKISWLKSACYSLRCYGLSCLQSCGSQRAAFRRCGCSHPWSIFRKRSGQPLVWHGTGLRPERGGGGGWLEDFQMSLPTLGLFPFQTDWRERFSAISSSARPLQARIEQMRTSSKDKDNTISRLKRRLKDLEEAFEKAYKLSDNKDARLKEENKIFQNVSWGGHQPRPVWKACCKLPRTSSKLFHRKPQ